MAKHFLSKTSYLRGLQCMKAVYLYKHHQKLRDPLNEEKRLQFQAGHEAGFRARNLFPGGVDASPAYPGRYKESIELCKSLMNEGVKIIYEAAFEFQGILIFLDILVKTPQGWIAYEVKSSVNISETYKNDAALQFYVIKKSGMSLFSFEMIHMQKSLSETDFKNSPEEIFTFTSLTDYCISQEEFVEQKIKEMREIIAYPKMPLISMGKQCSAPYPCEFIGFCSKQYSEPEEGLFG